MIETKVVLKIDNGFSYYPGFSLKKFYASEIIQENVFKN